MTRNNAISRPPSVPSIELSSTCLRHVAYDSRARVLDVEFRRGGRYRYLGVPSTRAGALLASPSLGRYFAHEIRGRYDFIRDDEAVNAPLP